MTSLVTHKRPDLDEILAEVMMKMFGESSFSNVSTADTLFRSANADVKPDEVGLGVGRKELDEHPVPGGKKKKDECAASLTAKKLGIFDSPPWRKLIAFATRRDSRVSGSPFDIAYVPKILFNYFDHEKVVEWLRTAIRAIYGEEVKNFQSGKDYNPDEDLWLFDRCLAAWLLERFGDTGLTDAELIKFVFNGEVNPRVVPDTIKELGVADNPALEKLFKFARTAPADTDLFSIRGVPALISRYNTNLGQKAAIDWLFMALDGKYRAEGEFRTSTAEEFEQKGVVREIVGPRGPIKLAIIDGCDDPQMQPFCRSKEGGGASVIIQRRSSGNVQIFTDQRARLNLRDLAAMLRFEEQTRMRKMETTDWTLLRAGGMLANWFYHEEGQMLLNGSLKADVTPTLLTLTEIVNLVCIALNPREFNSPGCADIHTCVSRSCPYYGWGLPRCRQIRFDNNHK